jgi:hypothetical protein
MKIVKKKDKIKSEGGCDRTPTPWIRHCVQKVCSWLMELLIGYKMTYLKFFCIWSKEQRQNSRILLCRQFPSRIYSDFSFILVSNSGAIFTRKTSSLFFFIEFYSINKKTIYFMHVMWGTILLYEFKNSFIKFFHWLIRLIRSELE